MNHCYPIQQRFYISRPQLLNTRQISIGSAPMYLTRTPNNIEYNVNVFPNGRKPAEAGRFVVFLQFKIPENLQVKASYNVIIGGSHNRMFQHCFKSSSSYGGIICPRQQLLHPTPSIVNDKLSIELVGNVSIQKQHLNLPVSVRANINYPFSSTSGVSNSPNPRNDFSYRMPIPPKIVQKEKSFVETPKTETEINVARILKNHLEEVQKTPKNVAETQTPKKKVESVTPVVESTPKQSLKEVPNPLSTNNENLTPVSDVTTTTTGTTTFSSSFTITDISKEVSESKAISEENETNISELPSDIHEPPPRSPEPRPTSETNESDIPQTDSSSSAIIEEPNRNKRARTRTSRYVEFVVETDDIGEEPVTKKSRKRRSNGVSPNTKPDGNDEYLPPRRSKSVARITTHVESSDPKITYDCKIEGAEKTFDVNKKMLSQYSNSFSNLFAINTKTSFELEGIPDRTLEAAFNFCHGLPLKAMNNKEFFSLLFFAYTFEMPELKKLCEERLAEKIALTNACDIANAAIVAKSEKLRNDCKKFFIEKVRNNVPLRNYVSLNKELKDEVCAAVSQSLQSGE